MTHLRHISNSATSNLFADSVIQEAEQLKTLCKEFKTPPNNLDSMVNLDHELGASTPHKDPKCFTREQLSKRSNEQIPWKLFVNEQGSFWKVKRKDGLNLDSGASKSATVGVDIKNKRLLAFVTIKLPSGRDYLKSVRRIEKEKKIALKLCEKLNKQRYYMYHKFTKSKGESYNEQYEVVMPLGIDLFRLVRQAPEVIDQVLYKMFQEMAAELKTLHQMKLAHCDVRPENFLYLENKETMLIDFGLSGNGATPLAPGTPIYAPIEILKNASIRAFYPLTRRVREAFGYTPKAQYASLREAQMGDIWGLGITFYTLLVKEQHPFQDILSFLNPKNDSDFHIPTMSEIKKAQSIARQELEERINQEQDVDKKQLLKLIRLMTLPDPKKRPTMAKVLEYLTNLDSVPNYSSPMSCMKC